MLEFVGPVIEHDGQQFGMDSNDIKQGPTMAGQSLTIEPGTLGYFAAQSFLGYQICALLAQNWLINKACSMKVRDAVKAWYTPTINDGSDVDEDVIAYIRRMDKKYKLRNNLQNAGYFNNVFGVRHVLFLVESDDPQYYEKPFNPDSIKPGSYKGMVQVDPYWLVPYLSTDEVSNPSSQHFYEPLHWKVPGRGKVHRSHFVILRGPEVADYLKPSYYYGGISLAQRIYERTYASERTANEAPQVAMSKRLNIRKVNLEQVAANPAAFEEAMTELVQYRDNFGVHVIDTKEEFEQYDSALTDFDATIMTQYQLVASIANETTPVPQEMLGRFVRRYRV